LDDKIEDVAASARPPSLAENLDQLSKLAQELSTEKRRGNNKGVEEKLRQMAPIEKAVQGQGRKEGRREGGKEGRREEDVRGKE
jgi:hypothetical protein